MVPYKEGVGSSISVFLSARTWPWHFWSVNTELFGVFKKKKKDTYPPPLPLLEVISAGWGKQRTEKSTNEDYGKLFSPFLSQALLPPAGVPSLLPSLPPSLISSLSPSSPHLIASFPLCISQSSVSLATVCLYVTLGWSLSTPPSPTADF